ncbi:MAG: ATP-binding cassette domain-containing protein [Chloroflexota bacterium]
MTTFIHCDNLVKIYKVADLEVVALQGLDLKVKTAEIVALVGASGSGKSTLLNILGGFDVPSAGDVVVAHQGLLDMTEAERTAYKQDVVGFVWQQPSRNLLPYLTAIENIELPMTRKISNKRARAMELLDTVGLIEQAHLRPEQLSGGQQQRVALAVALANKPSLLLADEPTGQLDSAAAQSLFTALRHINQTLGTTVVMVTHDPTVAARVDRVIAIRDGRTSTEIRRNFVGEGEASEEEWVVLDRVGRLQIPEIYMETLALKGHVKLRHEADHLSLWPAPDSDNNLPAPIPQWRPETTFVLDTLPYMEPPMKTAVIASNLIRTFGEGETAVQAVNNVSFTIPHGQFVLLKGRSGSGKTTLLNLLGGLDAPTSGSIQLYDQALDSLDEEARVALRRQHVSYIFQTFGLLPFLTAQENVELALRLLRLDNKTRQQQASELLDLVGLAARARHHIHELSGGEQQRVAVARALAGRPWVILADEPTGQLDTTTGSDIIALLRQVVDDLGTTIIVASHDPKVEEAVDVVLEMVDGRLLTSS